MRWKVVCLGQALRISRAMHASLTSRHNTLPYFFSMWINPQACFETCAYCTNSWEIWPCTSVSLRMAVLMVEWEALYSWAFGMEIKKKKRPQKQPCLTLHGWVIWRQVKQSCEFWAVRSDLLLFCHSFFYFFLFFYMMFFWQRANGQQGGWMGGSSLSDVFHLLLLRCQVWWLCGTTKHNSLLPLQKIHFYNLYRFTTKQS